MSKKAKITVLVIVVAVLAAVLVWGIVSCNYYFTPFGKMAGQQISGQAQVQAQFEVEAQGIQNIRLDFVSEGITVVATNESKIRVEETCNTKMDERDIMKCSLNGNTLVAESGMKNNWWNCFTWARYGDVKVTLYVPVSYANDLDLHSVSGQISLQDAKISGLKLDTVSGSIDAHNFESANLDVNSVSGGISVTGCKADTILAKNVSGEIVIDNALFRQLSGKTISSTYRVSVNTMPEKIDISSVSGGLKIELPENDGFTLHSETVSGGINNDFAIAHNVYKNGGNEISVKTTSGSIDIIKK